MSNNPTPTVRRNSPALAWIRTGLKTPSTGLLLACFYLGILQSGEAAILHGASVQTGLGVVAEMAASRVHHTHVCTVGVVAVAQRVTCNSFFQQALPAVFASLLSFEKSLPDASE